MNRRIVGIFLLALWGATAARAEPVSRREVLAAIAVLEQDVTGPDARQAAETVTRYGQESEAVLLVVGPETLPWVQLDAPEGETRVRSMLTAVYFAGDIKSQLRQRQPRDDPYSGWLAVIRAYQQIRKKQSEIVIPEVEELIRKDHAGTLKQEAEAVRRRQEEEQDSQLKHMV